MIKLMCGILTITSGGSGYDVLLGLAHPLEIRRQTHPAWILILQGFFVVVLLQGRLDFENPCHCCVWVWLQRLCFGRYSCIFWCFQGCLIILLSILSLPSNASTTCNSCIAWVLSVWVLTSFDRSSNGVLCCNLLNSDVAIWCISS